MFNIIVLLNVLIAIVSETFNKVYATSDRTSYLEKALMIANLQDTIFGMECFQTDPDNTKFIFIAKAIEKSDNDKSDDKLSKQLFLLRLELK